MKVLWFTNTPCGASERLLPDLHDGGWLKSLEKELVKSNGIELYIAFYWNYPLKVFKIDKTTYVPITTKYLRNKLSRIFFRNFLGERMDYENKTYLLEVIKRINPDIIHVHGTEENYGIIQLDIKIPVVISIQGILSPLSEKYFSGIHSHVAQRYEDILTKLQLKSAKRLFRVLVRKAKRERIILKNSKHIIGRTEWDKRVCNLLAPKSIYYNGGEILRDSFYLAKWQKGPFSTVIKIVTVTSGKLYKGLETIVKTALLLKQYDHFNFEWTVVGISENSALSKLVKSWLKVEYSELSINLVGIKQEGDIVKTLLDSDVYCQVSHIENSPNSLCEAMLIGMPIVASFAGGTSSILRDGKEGILVQDGDPYSYAGAILEISADYLRALDYANASYNTAQVRHKRSEIAKQTIDIYKQILEKFLNGDN
jgi:glycosyltransferase involved in cell wall biosynthesis